MEDLIMESWSADIRIRNFNHLGNDLMIKVTDSDAAVIYLKKEQVEQLVAYLSKALETNPQK